MTSQAARGFVTKTAVSFLTGCFDLDCMRLPFGIAILSSTDSCQGLEILEISSNFVKYL